MMPAYKRFCLLECLAELLKRDSLVQEAFNEEQINKVQERSKWGF